MTDSTNEARAFLVVLGGLVKRDLRPHDSALRAAWHAIELGYSAGAAKDKLEAMGHNLTKARDGGMVLGLLWSLPVDPDLVWRRRLPAECPHGHEPPAAPAGCKRCRLDAGDPRQVGEAIRDGLGDPADG